MTDAAPASTPATALRRVAIDPISRVEGHGKVTLLIDESNRVVQARLHIVEFRGFEQFIAGRPYWEVPVMVQRLCGICPVSHHLAATKALDAALGISTLTPTATLCRRLMHYGQILQSHALHFFHLSAPDLLFGFASPAQRRNLVGLAAAHPETARKGVLLRKFGQEIIFHTSGKRVHGTGAVPGGVNRALTPAARAQLQAQCEQIVTWSGDAVALVRQLMLSHRAQFDDFARVESGFMSLVDPAGGLDLYAGALRVRDRDGDITVDQFPVARYRELIEEGVEPWTYMKFPYLRSVGAEAGWYRVGPLARLQNCAFLPTPLAEAARCELLAHGAGKPLHGSLLYHWARMIEMLHAAETIRQLLSDERLCGNELLVAPQRAAGSECEGVGVIEAPRGTLIHHYRIGEDDLITMANLIVSTTHNNQAMNVAVRDVARHWLDGEQLTPGLLNHIEVAIRAFDPCLSCATHALGQMPLEVRLEKETFGGTAPSPTQTLDVLLRHADGRVERPATPAR